MIGIGVGINRQRFASGIFTAYAARVAADGGVTEAGACVDAVRTLLQRASLLLIPSGYKSDKVYSQKPTDGNGDLTFTRTSDATRVNSDGLIEIPRTNLLRRSEEFEDASWTKTATSVTANTTTSPNGTVNAETISIGIDLSALRHRLTQSPGTITIGTTYTGTYYLKANAHQWIQMVAVSGFSTGVWANFNLSTGVIGNTGGVDTTASIENVGDGWYRCRVSGVATGTSTTGFEILVINNTNSVRYPSYQSLVAEDVCYVWGAQFQVGVSATEYIPTTTSIRTKFAGITQDGASATGVPRLDYSQGSCPSLLLEPQRTNSLRNSTMVGTVAGTPGTLPTNYSTLTRNLTQQIIGTGTLNGVNYIDIRFFGISNDSVNPVRIIPEASLTQIIASPNQSWTSTVWFDILDETLPPNNYSISIDERTSTGGFISSERIDLIPGFVRNSLSRILSSPTAARVSTDYRFGVTDGQAYDFTVRIGGPQLELGAYATAWIPTTNAIATRLVDTFSLNNIFTNGLITSSGGTWFVELRNNVEYVRDGTGGFPLFISSTSTSGAGSNSLEFRNAVSGSSARLAILKRIGGVGAILFNTTTDIVKVAFKWNGTTADLFVNGVKEVTATEFTPTSMEFLNGFGTDVPLFIQAMALYPSPLSDTDCIALTTL